MAFVKRFVLLLIFTDTGYFSVLQVDKRNHNESLEPEVKVNCNEREITITVIRSKKFEAIWPTNVKFRQQQHDCEKAESSNNTIRLKIDTKMKVCGSTITQLSKSQKLVQNELIYENSDTNSSIHLVNVTCLFVSGKNISLLSSTFRSTIIADQKVTIKLYKDDTFSSDYNFENDFPTIPVKDYLNFDVSLEKNSNSTSNQNLFINVENCYATLADTPTRDSEHFHSLIKNRCPVPTDPTVEILDTNRSNSFRFRFQMFNWINITVQRIFVFCNVSYYFKNDSTIQEAKMCNGKKDTQKLDACESNCSNIVSSIIGIGPIFSFKAAFFSEDKDLRPTSASVNNIHSTVKLHITPLTTSHIIGIICAVGFFSIVLVFIIYAIWRCCGEEKLRKSFKRSTAKHESTKAGFAFSMKSSREICSYIDLEGSNKSSKET